MENAITWAIIGVFSLFLVIGFLVGVIRGIKRSTLHIVFVIVSIVLSFLLTKTITNLILGIKIPINGTTQTISEHIISFVESNFNISDFKTATDFVLAVPMAVASPFVFFALQIVLNGLLGIVYLIVARVSFHCLVVYVKCHQSGKVNPGPGACPVFYVLRPCADAGRTVFMDLEGSIKKSPRHKKAHLSHC